MPWETRKRSGVMLCYPFEVKRLEKWNPPYIVQPKYDGVRCRALKHFTPENKKTWLLISSTEDLIISVPHIVLALEQLNVPPEMTELDGELYRHGWSFEQIYSVTSRTANMHPEYEKVNYHIFDEVRDITQQAQRLVNISQLKMELPLVRAPHVICWTLEDVMNAYQIFIDEGFEGMVVRHFEAPYLRRRSIYAMKFKPKKKDVYKIIGWKEEIDKYGNPKNRLGALVCEKDGQTFSVGSGFNVYDREELWKIREYLPDMFVEVEYQHTTPGRGVPRFPVYSKIVKVNPEDF